MAESATPYSGQSAPRKVVLVISFKSKSWPRKFVLSEQDAGQTLVAFLQSEPGERIQVKRAIFAIDGIESMEVVDQ